MILRVDEFRDQVATDLNGLVDAVVDSVSLRFVTDAERKAMKSSYQEVSRMLGEAVAINPGFASVHIGTSQLFLEYKLPAAPAWCDLVLLGEGFGQKQAVILELKDWVRNDTDAPGPFEGLIRHQGNDIEHPADQVRGYTEYCRAFHSAVVENAANVAGCVYFTRDIDLTPYLAEPNDHLVRDYPLFNTLGRLNLARFVARFIQRGNATWATAFVNGFYKQNRNNLEQVARSFGAMSTERPFVLVEGQREGYNKIRATIRQCLNDNTGKSVIIVQGPPGSGKSAIALNLWTDVARETTLSSFAGMSGNVVFTTTSSSQNENWSSIFRRFGGHGGAGGFVLKANDFNPGLTGKTMKEVLVPHFKAVNPGRYLRDENSLKFDFYEEYTEHMLRTGMARNYRDNLHLVSIVDEAHALINPTAKGFSTNKLGGWCLQMGPQAYHIIRESRISVFFLDGQQSFRDSETTTMEDLKDLAAKLGAKITEVSLAGMQFRCAGSAEYVEWVEHLFSTHPVLNASKWRGVFDVAIANTTGEMEKWLSAKGRDAVVRLLSSYSVPWISKNTLNRMHTPGHGDVNFDFDFENEDGSRFRRHWNNPENYDVFVQAPVGTKMHEDPLCEVGCPYVMRGFDADWTGVLWLDDIVWRNGRWVVNPECALETANSSSRSQAEKEQIEANRHRGLRGAAAKRLSPFELDDPSAPKAAAFSRTVVQAYRILLTRAVKGICLYIHDPETRAHVRQLLAD